MGKSLILTLLLFNISTATLHNVMVVAGDEATEIGSIESGVCKQVEIPLQDSIRVIFTLGQKREGWLGTDLLPMRDTIRIDNKTQTFELEIENFSR